MEVPEWEVRLRSRAHVDAQQMILWPMNILGGSNSISGVFEGEEVNRPGFPGNLRGYNPFGRGMYRPEAEMRRGGARTGVVTRR